MPIIDTRRLEFSAEALAVALEGCGPGLLGLPQERPVEVRCLPARAALQIRYAATGIHAHLVQGSELAALLIGYCRAVRIPLPSRAIKSISVSDSGVAMMMTVRHQNAPRVEAADVQQRRPARGVA